MRNPIEIFTGAKSTSNSAPVPYTPNGKPFTGNFLQQSGMESQMAAFGNISTLFAIVSQLALSTSRHNWNLYRPQTDNRRVYGPMDSERKEITKHPALSVWNRPNEFMTQQEFIEIFQQHLELTGEAIWVIYREARFGLPSELWPVRPDRVFPIPSASNFIAGYVYVAPDGQRIPLQNDEVIRLKQPNPLNLYRGMSAVQPLLIDLESYRFSAEWYRQYFLNSAEPGGIIQVEDTLDDDEFKKVLMRWNEQHRGISRAHRVAVLEAGMQWVNRSYSLKELQFSELRTDLRDVIREGFGIHKQILGVSDDVNRANAEAGYVVYNRDKIAPRLNRIKDALNFQFMPKFGKVLGTGAEWDFCNPVPEDREMDNQERISKAQAYNIYVGTGADPEKVSEFLGIPDLNPPMGGNDGQLETSGTPELPSGSD